MGIEIKILRDGDGAILENLDSEVFDDPLDPAATAEFLRDPRHHLAVAIDGALVIGFASAVHYVHPDKRRPEMWINEVAVSPRYRGRGIGRRLIEAMLDAGRALGCSEAWVLTDRKNPQAMRMYAAAGGAEGSQDHVMFTFRPGLAVRREPLDSAVAQSLITALNAELTKIYPEDRATHFSLTADELLAFVVAYRDAVPVGCGAMRRLDATTAELKRMYVIPEARGEGIGRAVLEALEAEARKLGVARLVLETGIRQDAALGLYRSSGFREIELFGEYLESPSTSVCMAKDLA